MSWVAKLYPEDGNLAPVTVGQEVISYEIIMSSETSPSRIKKYLILNFQRGHLTVLFDTNVSRYQTVYRRLELFNRFGNMVVAHGNNFHPLTPRCGNHKVHIPVLS